MTRLILVRHGETEWNVDMRFQGQSDIALSPNGREQAKLAAVRLAAERIDAAYTSDLCRCSETARIILDGRDVDPLLRPDLREMNFGDWEGLTFEQINTLSPGVLERMRTDLRSFQAPGGEAWMDLENRVGGFLDETLARHPRDSVLVVAHVNPLRVLFTRVLQGRVDGLFRLRLYNCSVSIFEVDSKGTRVVSLNDSCHLEDKWP